MTYTKKKKRTLTYCSLAIELAAARTRLLPPRAAAWLDRRLKVLTGGTHTLPARQQTLRNAIAWSLRLLDGEEEGLWTSAGGVRRRLHGRRCRGSL